ncbi:MAG: NADP-dependent oxidoreductase [Gammaproteobacteria bacterium]|nr:NADP-dependent oxidoreductase [Gammaproteobacteria bacterium]
MITNRQWRLKRLVSEGEHPGPEHFEFGQAPVPDLQPGEILVQTIVLGTSPAQRMYVSTERQFHFAVEIGEVMSCRGVGRVVASRHAGFAVDDIVQASLGWQDYAVLAPEASEDPSHNVRNVRKVPAPVRPLTTVLGLFGQLAYSAYVGVIEVGQVRSGDTVVVSAAAGGVGSIACQLARIQGAERVIGIAGGQDKCRWLLERGLCDEVIDYRQDSVGDALGRLCPDGLDVYLDSVGGDMLDTALQHLAVGARVVLCGMISTEYQRPRPPGPTHYFNLLYQRSRMEGFFVFDYVDRWPAFEARLREWYRQGRLVLTDDVAEGLEHAPAALGALFAGGNTGGRVIRVSQDPQHLPHIDDQDGTQTASEHRE